jgi:hypothetical protein
MPAVAEVTRFPGNPIITPQSSVTVGDNINGPSLIRVPGWVRNPLGRYYLYFAGHRGARIHLAYADRLEGPWIVHEAGTLTLEQVCACRAHIASPDVHVDDHDRRIRMYFHGPAAVDGRNLGQCSFVALSEDGIRFTPLPDVLGGSYFRVFFWNGWYYALARAGQLYRSRDGLRDFEKGPELFGGTAATVILRHCAVILNVDALVVFYSRIGDCPECILLSTVALTSEWSQWRESEPSVVLQPETDYEGVGLPLEPSRGGAAPGRVRQLRDPAIFQEAGKTYLLYSVAGENGIAIAEINELHTLR